MKTIEEVIAAIENTQTRIILQNAPAVSMLVNNIKTWKQKQQSLTNMENEIIILATSILECPESDML